MAKPSRGTEILVFGPFCDVIWRDSRKKVLRYSELREKTPPVTFVSRSRSGKGGPEHRDS